MEKHKVEPLSEDIIQDIFETLDQLDAGEETKIYVADFSGTPKQLHGLMKSYNDYFKRVAGRSAGDVITFKDVDHENGVYRRHLLIKKVKYWATDYFSDFGTYLTNLKAETVRYEIPEWMDADWLLRYAKKLPSICSVSIVDRVLFGKNKYAERPKTLNDQLIELITNYERPKLVTFDTTEAVVRVAMNKIKRSHEAVSFTFIMQPSYGKVLLLMHRNESIVKTIHGLCYLGLSEDQIDRVLEFIEELKNETV